MISDEERRNMASSLRHDAAYGEGWLVNGTFNYCSECGREVVE